ncbi:hypothetical protein [Candidatus Synechococcus spongiarum]|uniref:hypothetical protein n=1 Tax=Candidatus Synechococcus spongiarum TaxID=431041 RepID=UPI000470AF0B|nr:hypothetical protein [Candidatus Synechococcus spongiarum]
MTWKGSNSPSLSSLHATDAVTYPYICDTKTYDGALTNCDRTQIKTIYGSNSDLMPSKSKNWSFGGIAELGHLSLAAEWFRVESSDLPAGPPPSPSLTWKPGKDRQPL